MAVEPSVTKCDFCSAVLEAGRHVAKLELPIQPALRREMITATEASMSERAKTSPISMMFGGVDAMVPHVWRLELCVGCAYAIFSGAAEKVKEQVTGVIQRGIDAKRRTLESDAELEETAGV